MVRRGKRHDYFTSCLPWPQEGPGVEISIGGVASVRASGTPTFKPVEISGTTGQLIRNPNTLGGVFSTGSGFDFKTVDFAPDGYKVVGDTGSMMHLDWLSPGLQVDLSTATPISINDLRQAFQIQKLYERDGCVS